MDILQEKQLVKDIVSGDLDAFRHIIDNYQKLVSHIVFRMVPLVDARQDICQDVFLRVYNHLGSFRFQCRLSTWIAQIAYNRCINFLQKKKVPLYEDVAPEDLTLEHVGGTDNLSDFDMTNRDMREIVRSSIELLPAKYKTVITLYHLEQMSYEEIGEITGMAQGTVKSYLFRARNLLKEHLSARFSKEELLY